MSMVYICVISYGLLTFNKYSLKDAKDNQEIEINEIEVENAGKWDTIKLPIFIDVENKKKLKISLNYNFENDTKPCIIIQANHTFMTFYLNGKEIYTVAPQEKSLGNYFLSVPLPSKADNDTLEIAITSTENGLHRIQVPQLFITDDALYLKKILKSDTIAIALNILIALFSFQMIIISFLNRKSNVYWKIFMQGLAALNMSIYFMCETYSIVYVFSYSRIIYYLDMLSFSMIAPSMILVFSFDLHSEHKKSLYTLAWLGLANTFIQTIFGIFTPFDMRSNLIITQILQVTSTVAIVSGIIIDLVKKRRIKSIFMLLFVILCGLTDITLFAFEMNYFHNVFFLKIGIIVYLFQQIFLYTQKLIKQVEQRTREHYYKKLAFQDALTSCLSRIAYELDKKDYEFSSQLTIFTFDVNDLKIANDFYGHEEGDCLLKCFGNVLNVVFHEFGKIYRTGGDEFVIFCPNLTYQKSDELLLTLENVVNEINEKSVLKIPLSYAVGVSNTYDTDGNLETAIFISDERMYENKRQIKELKMSKCTN